MALAVRPSWLARVTEPVIEPERRIVDPHHHFFVPGGAFPAYDLADLWADTASHKVEQTVYLQCWEGYRADGPEALRCVGETESVDAVARQAAASPGRTRIGGIIASCELRLGARVRPVLEAHCAASPLFRGIRQAVAWDADEAVMSMPGFAGPDAYDDPDYRAGVAVLGEMGLVLDTYHYHHQLPSMTRMARALPEVQFVLDHLGTPLGVGPYAGRRDEIFAQWASDMRELAGCANVAVKLGGLAMPWNGFGFDEQPGPPDSDEIVRRQAPYYHHAIELFGPERCMFESNFPVDKCALSYTVLWNAFKKMAAGYSETEKDMLFRATATRIYRL